MKNKFIKNHWYKVKDLSGDVWVGRYDGIEDDWDCSIVKCKHEGKAHVFTVQVNSDCDEEPDIQVIGNFSIYHFCDNHLPELIEDLGILKEPYINN